MAAEVAEWAGGKLANAEFLFINETRTSDKTATIAAGGCARTFGASLAPVYVLPSLRALRERRWRNPATRLRQAAKKCTRMCWRSQPLRGVPEGDETAKTAS